MTVVAFTAIAFLLAFLVESMTEYIFGTAVDKFPALSRWRWTLMYIALGVGVGMAFYYQLDLISMIASLVDQTIPVSWLGILLSGLAIGRGSNYIHQLMSEHLPKR
jgi:hypothetical protein